MMDKDNVSTPWREGKWKVKDGGPETLTLARGKLCSDVVENEFESEGGAELKYGRFGEADPKIVEMTGEKYYNLESRYDMVGKEKVDYGVLMDDGTTMVVKAWWGIGTLVWITDEEAEQMANSGDSISAPSSHYKVEPERQGRLIWITGPPGLGKSTSAQLLSREKGFVFYESDCFFGLKNPYIPPDVDNPSLAQVKQKRLVGEGAEERKKVIAKVTPEYKKMVKGEAYNVEVLEEGMRENFRDVARERARLGGDWAIAGVLFTSKMRQMARFVFYPTWMR